MKILYEIFDVVENRKKNPKKSSYTSELFSKGDDKILEKIGEEAAELIIAGKNNKKDEIIYEAGDLIFHILVLLSAKDIKLEEVEKELERRRKK